MTAEDRVRALLQALRVGVEPTVTKRELAGDALRGEIRVGRRRFAFQADGSSIRIRTLPATAGRRRAQAALSLQPQHASG